MASLQDYASGVDDILRPYGDLDVLLYYGLISQKLQKFLHGRELATRTLLPKGKIPVIVKRGSYHPPLYIGQMARAVTPELMDARKKHDHLEGAKHMLSPDQALVWLYFVPRKYMSFHYATNREGKGREINRVFYDIDRSSGVTQEDAIEVAALLVRVIMEDEDASKLFHRDPLVSWTGNSFHVMLFLKELQPSSFYSDQIEYTGRGRTLSDRWISRVSAEAKVPVVSAHEKRRDTIIIDPSQTPSGKLCSVPLGSLHMASATTFDGVSVPLTTDMLERSLVADLRSYTPERIIDELDELAKRLP